MLTGKSKSLSRGPVAGLLGVVGEDREEDEGEEEEEEAVFARESITDEDPPNAHQAQHQPRQRVDE